MTGDDLYCSRNFSRLPESEHWLYLVWQNAYFIWERRTAKGLPDTPQENWATAEAYVAEHWRAWFSPEFLKSLCLPHASVAMM